MYQHRDSQGQPLPLPVGKIVCVGRNYADHIAELNNATPDQPVLFMKPATSAVAVQQPFSVPVGHGPCHNELELALLIAKPLCNARPEEAMAAVWGIGLGLDLTLRSVQQQLKEKQLPWERAKAFDGACPLSFFVPIAQCDWQQGLGFSLQVNGSVRQQGDSRLMLFDMPHLLSDISQQFTLLPGDVVMTGTPKGVGPLQDGDALRLTLEGHFHIDTHVTTQEGRR
ncbi:fumarylacetoacetate hydrolase family protein [Aestuariibacter halophilus]|uniref:Fumarylacetoacetate hydrolase family protein n=2 Tax=Fluctibacter halophilus TaxID=226011 RepID=A0ABS8G7Y1_9ALTE|nr:fumarylacetoacetate hydrolase family protein [Aestuariibacter halophilus]